MENPKGFATMEGLFVINYVYIHFFDKYQLCIYT